MPTDAARLSTATRWWKLAPGIALVTLLASVAYLLQSLEVRLIGHEVIEALVLAIFVGILWRNLWGVADRWQPGVNFSAKNVLEFAIVLLGASVDLPALLKAGPALLLAIAIAVAVGIVASIVVGRLLGLNRRLAILVAVGNSICGNSAIAAVAPVIKAGKEDIASSIALTAVVGVLLVIGLPLLIPLLNFSLYQYGVLAGMTVYAVPQVLAATFPVSTLSGEIGTLVKLVRVLLLGPVVLLFSLSFGASEAAPRAKPTRYVPWFIIGFLILGSMRSIGVLPAWIADPLREGSRWLTIAAMAALGLGVDIRALRRVGLSVTAAVLASLTVLIAVSVLLIRSFSIGAA